MYNISQSSFTLLVLLSHFKVNKAFVNNKFAILSSFSFISYWKDIIIIIEEDDAIILELILDVKKKKKIIIFNNYVQILDMIDF